MSTKVVLIIAIVAVWLLIKFWPWLSSKLALAWANRPQFTATGGTTAPPAKATITVEQALAAEMLLEKFKGQNGTDLGSKLVLKGIEALAEKTP